MHLYSSSPPGLVGFTRHVLPFLLYDFLFNFSSPYPTDHLWKVTLQLAAIIRTWKASVTALLGATDETLDGFLHVPLFLWHLKKEKLQQETGADVTDERTASNNIHYPNDSVLLLFTWTPSCLKKKTGEGGSRGRRHMFTYADPC